MYLDDTVNELENSIYNIFLGVVDSFMERFPQQVFNLIKGLV
jgi:hypothetical protein